MQKLLITGASGMIGKRLTEMLLPKGYQVNHIGRNPWPTSAEKNSITHFIWDIEKGKMDNNAFDGVTAIIHLAGAGVAEARWTKKRKQEMINSRVKGAGLISDFLRKGNHEVKTFISASAVGYYGDCGSELISEKHGKGAGFLADLCEEWEQAAINIGKQNIREVRCRIGVVLSLKGGALQELTRTMPYGFAGYFSKNELYYPWVHIDDVCGIIIHAIESEKLSGAYNTTAPNPLPLKDLMAEIIKARKSKVVLIATPPIAIKLALGEMSEILLGSQRCLDDKIVKGGYKFQFPEIKGTLENLFNNAESE